MRKNNFISKTLLLFILLITSLSHTQDSDIDAPKSGNEKEYDAIVLNKQFDILEEDKYAGLNEDYIKNAMLFRKIYTGHTEGVQSLALSPDGKLIASCSLGKNIIIWDSATFEKKATLTGHNDYTYSVAFSPDGKYLASGSKDKTIIIWDTENWTTKHILTNHIDSVITLAFSPDGKYLASGSKDNSIRIWELPNFTEKTVLAGHFDVIMDVKFSPDGKYLVSASRDLSIRVWDVNKLKLEKNIFGHFDYISTIDFSSSAEFLASGSTDTTIKIWNYPDFSEAKTLPAHSDYIMGIAFTNDKKYMVSVARNGELALWNLPDFKLIKKFDTGVTINDVLITQNDKYIILADMSANLRVYDFMSLFRQDYEKLAKIQNIIEEYGEDGKKILLEYGFGGAELVERYGDNIVSIFKQTGEIYPEIFEHQDLTSLDKSFFETGNPQLQPFPVAKVGFNKSIYKAGDIIEMKVITENKGKGTNYQLGARILTNDIPIMYLPFGKLEPGEKKLKTTKLLIPHLMPSQRVRFAVEFIELNGFIPSTVSIKIPIEGLSKLELYDRFREGTITDDELKQLVNTEVISKPKFLFSKAVIDGGTDTSVGNKDGKIHKGESVDLFLTITNAGDFPSAKINMEIIPLTNDANIIFYVKSHEIPFISPRSSQTVRFNFGVRRGFEAKELKLLVKAKAENFDTAGSEIMTFQVYDKIYD